MRPPSHVGNWFCVMTGLADVWLMPVVVDATGVVAWRVQVDILARRRAWDYITDRELEGAWLELSRQAVRQLAAIHRQQCRSRDYHNQCFHKTCPPNNAGQYKNEPRYRR